MISLDDMSNIINITYRFSQKTKNVRITYFLGVVGFVSYFSISGKLFIHDQINNSMINEIKKHLNVLGFKIGKVVE